MKKFKGLIGASLLVFSSLSLVSLSACKSEEVNNNEQKDPIIEEGSLTIFNKDNSISIKFSYDKNLVSLTHDDLTNLISGDNYSFSLSVKDSSLNVIDSVKANDSTISPFAGGKYYFSLKEGENKVDITLKNIDVGYKKEDNVGNKATYYDIWKNTGYPHPNSVGNQKMLVVPVNIKGYEKYATDENLNNIKKAFFGNDNKYLSLSNYYKESSYNKLNITGEVTPWFNVDLTFDEISKKETNGDLGTYYVLDKAVEWVQKSINLSDYDVDKDGFIDSIYLIYSAPSYVDKEDTSTNKYSTLAWNFTFYNKNNKDKGNVASPLSMTYSWSSLSMLNQDSDLKGEDTHTYIHEFGHQLGLTDYYDTTSSAMIKFTPMGRIDMMDDSVGDHSAFSKFALGWVSPKRVYGVNGELNIDLSSFSKDGDFLILTGYNQKRGDEYNGTPFDEYVILEYLTLDNKINAYDSTYGYNTPAISGNPKLYYFKDKGIRVTHIDARAIDEKGAYTDKVEEMYRVKLTNTASTADGYRDPTTNESYLLTYVVSAVATKNVLGGTAYTATSEDLFKAGSNFNFTKGKNKGSRPMMMPSNDEYLNDGSLFSYDVYINSLDEKASITIK